MKASIDITKSKFYQNIIKQKKSCYFISPHLDDAVFSSASLLIDLIEHDVPVTIINVFSQPGPKPYTLSVYKFLWQCGYRDADLLFAHRRQEDGKVISQLGAKVVNLDLVDALWRRSSQKGLRQLLGRFIGEATYVYPMYRFGLAQGIVAPSDKNLYRSIGHKLNSLIDKNDIVFCPLGIGRHVDHLIVRDSCQKYFLNNQVVYWSDYPYETEKPNESDFISSHNLKPYKFLHNKPMKNTLINGYLSQLNVIFGGTIDHSHVIETYYIYGK